MNDTWDAHHRHPHDDEDDDDDDDDQLWPDIIRPTLPALASLCRPDLSAHLCHGNYSTHSNAHNNTIISCMSMRINVCMYTSTLSVCLQSLP